MNSSVRREPELTPPIELGRELAKPGPNVGVSDARPTVVTRDGTMPLNWAMVDVCGGHFEWNQIEKHWVSDPSGAAIVIAEHHKTKAACAAGAQ